MSSEESDALHPVGPGRRLLGRGLSVDIQSRTAGAAEDVFKPSPLLRKLDSLEIGSAAKLESSTSEPKLPGFLGVRSSPQAPRVGRITPPALSPVLPRSNSNGGGLSPTATRAVDSPRVGLASASPRSDSPRLSPLQTSGSQSMFRSQSATRPAPGGSPPVSARGPGSNSGMSEITDITELDAPLAGKTSPTAPPKLNIAPGSRPLSSGQRTPSASAAASDWPAPGDSRRSPAAMTLEDGPRPEPRKTTKLSSLGDAPKILPRNRRSGGGDEEYQPDADWWPEEQQQQAGKLAGFGALPKMQKSRQKDEDSWPG